MENVQHIESTLLQTFLSIWQFQLFEVEGSPITLGKVTVGLILISMGYFVARLGSRLIRRRFLVRLQLDMPMQYALEKVSFYFIYIFIVLFVMQLLSIPVTIFTLVGGALAIGVGFGSQNIVSNFISGLIVMVEQPLRVGDWIEIDGVFGQVKAIGGRSTTLILPDNKTSVVPNSFFLEKMFTNWTLGNPLVGGRLSVGVAYGTDPNKVRELLLKAALEHPSVLKEPAPIVLFQDFAESSLNFDLVFSVHLSNEVTVRRVASDLRFRLNDLFKEQGIVIPYPQRELHLLAEKPLSVFVKNQGPH